MQCDRDNPATPTEYALVLVGLGSAPASNKRALPIGREAITRGERQHDKVRGGENQKFFTYMHHPSWAREWSVVLEIRADPRSQIAQSIAVSQA